MVTPVVKIDAPLLTLDAREAGPLAQALEAQGYDGTYTFDGRTDPFLPLAFAAEHTARLELSTAIAVAFARNPMIVAQTASDLQRLSRGRFTLGLGSQVRAHIEKRFSMPWSAPAARMRDFVLALRAIWQSWQTEERLNFRGQFYTHTLSAPLMASPPNPYGQPRIALAGVGPLMTEVAGEVADGYLIHPFHSEAYLEQLALPALQRGLARSGRGREDLEISCQILVAAGRDRAELSQAVQEMRAQIAFYASTPAYRPVLESIRRAPLQEELNALSKQGQWAEMGARIDDEVLHAVAIVGTPEEAARTILERYARRVDRISPFGYIRNPAVAAETMKALLKAISPNI